MVAERAGGETFVHSDDVWMLDARPRVDRREPLRVHEAKVYGAEPNVSPSRQRRDDARTLDPTERVRDAIFLANGLVHAAQPVPELTALLARPGLEARRVIEWHERVVALELVRQAESKVRVRNRAHGRRAPLELLAQIIGHEVVVRERGWDREGVEMVVKLDQSDRLVRDAKRRQGKAPYGLLEVGRGRRWEEAGHVLVIEVIVRGVSHRHIWLRVIRIEL